MAEQKSGSGARAAKASSGRGGGKRRAKGSRATLDARGVQALLAVAAEDPPPVTMVVGPEADLARLVVAALISAARTANPDLPVERISPRDDDAAMMLDTLMQPSLFGSERIVICTDLETAADDLVEAVKRAVATADPSTRLVLVHGGQSRGRGAVNAAEKAGAQRLDCPAVAKRDLPAVLTWYARESGGLLASDAADVIIDRLGHDLGVLLAATAQVVDDAPEQRVSAQDVRASLAGQGAESQFEIADLIWQGNTEQALRGFRRLIATHGPASGPVIMVAALSYSLRGLARATAAGLDPRDRAVAAQLGVPGWKAGSIITTARRWGGRRLGRAAVLLGEAEADVKGGLGDEGALDPEQKVYAVERLIVTLGEGGP